MTLPASKAVYNQTVELFATAVDEPGRFPAVPAAPARVATPSTSPRAAPRQDPPDFTGALQQLNAVPPTVERPSAQVSDLRELLWRVLAYPSVSSHFGASATIRPLFVGFDLLGKVLEKARLDGIAEAAVLDPPVLAERLLASGVPMEIQLEGIFLTEQIEPFWRAFRSGVPLP
jgi:hypothetical protein